MNAVLLSRTNDKQAQIIFFHFIYIYIILKKNIKFKKENDFSVENIEQIFKDLATEKNIKPGELQMILRVMLVGSKIGPGVFIIAETIGQDETIKRIGRATSFFIPI